MKEQFRKLSVLVSRWTGSAYAFLIALLLIIFWAITGPSFNYSDTWQLIINTGTTIVVFLMVFLIQNTQNRDSRAIQLKLDELIIANKKARDTFVGLESLTDEELSALDEEFTKLQETLSHSPSMAKLHKHIKAEHAKRKGLLGTAEKLMNSVSSHND
jgi:low affinity Fe/Cu permease